MFTVQKTELIHTFYILLFLHISFSCVEMTSGIEPGVVGKVEKNFNTADPYHYTTAGSTRWMGSNMEHF